MLPSDIKYRKFKEDLMKKFSISALVTIISLTFGSTVFATEPAAMTKTEPAMPTAKIKRIDINTATENQLKAVLGVRDEQAKKIIAGRPYTNRDQLKSKNIMPANDYAKIKRLIDAVC
jgi:competence protein ComEA